MSDLTPIPFSYKLRRFLIFLYGFSICFGTFALTGSSRNFTLSFIVAIIYILSLLPIMGNLQETLRCYAKYIRPIILFFILLCLMNWLNENEYDVAIVPISILSCIILFIFMLLHNRFDNKAITYCMYGYMIGATVLSVLFFLGIGVYLEFGTDIAEGERISMFGQNQNELGMIMVNGITLAVLLVLIYNKLNIGVWRYLVIIPLITMSLLMFAAASRTAFFALAAIMVCFVFMHKTKGRYTRLLFLLAGFVGIWYAYQYFISSDSLMYARILETIKSGSTSGRTDIWNKLIPRLMETPIFGVGQTGYSLVAHQCLMSIAGNMYEYGYSPHNVLIEIFAYTGIVGLSIMLIFWLRVTIAGFESYKYNNNLVPLLLFIPVVAFILTGQILANKFAWVLYAYMITQAYQVKLNKP